MKNKTDPTISNAFQKLLYDSNRKPNKIWVDKGSESYSGPMKSWLQVNDIKVHSILNEGRYFAGEKTSKTFLLKVTLQIGLKKFFCSVDVCCRRP